VRGHRGAGRGRPDGPGGDDSRPRFDGVRTWPSAGGTAVADSATLAADGVAAMQPAGRGDGAARSGLIAGAANASALGVGRAEVQLAGERALWRPPFGFSFADLAHGHRRPGRGRDQLGSDAGTSLKTIDDVAPARRRCSRRSCSASWGASRPTAPSRRFTAEGSVKSMAEVAQVLQDSLAGMTDAQRIATPGDAVRVGRRPRGGGPGEGGRWPGSTTWPRRWARSPPSRSAPRSCTT
jgi:hypothetical protein